MSISTPQCPIHDSLDQRCSCPKTDCPRHGLCCECIVAHKARVEDPLPKRLPHCLRSLIDPPQGKSARR